MRNRFNKRNYNIKRLQPSADEIELNRCTHIVDVESEKYECLLCGTIIKQNLDIENFINSAFNVAEYLETMKMVANNSLSRKEYKAAQKYFDMIPYLRNIRALYNICEEANNTITEPEYDDEFDEEPNTDVLMEELFDNNVKGKK